MRQYFGTAQESLLDQIDFIRSLGLHATASDMHNPYGIPGPAGSEGSQVKTIEQMMSEHMQQEASPA